MKEYNSNMTKVKEESMTSINDSNLNLKIRTTKGIIKLPALPKSACVMDLKKKIADITGYDINSFSIMKGYPPKSLDSINTDNTLTEILLNNGDVLIVQEMAPNNAEMEPMAEKVKGGGILMKRIVPADNSCLFTSLVYLLSDGTAQLVDSKRANQFRAIVAANVLAFDPSKSRHFSSNAAVVREYDTEDANFLAELLTPAVLGKRSNAAYAEWISSPESWGGAIELAILSRHFSVEMVVADVQSTRLERFGRDAGYVKAVALLYDGIHYDPLVMEHDGGTPQVKVQTIFNTLDVKSYQDFLDQALEIASQAKKAHQFTAVGTFCLKCYQCDAILVGETKAQEHAKKTGHTRFGEIRRD